MCGIIGYFAKGGKIPERAALDRAVDAMTHRGPDRRGIWTGDRVGLGFRRLSVIDLETGDQPMGNESGSLHIVFNGEIYNYRALRDHLKSKGRRFRTQSDTEVILHLYEEEGEHCVDHLRGMFAFAIHDRDKNALFLARDRFGKKPLVCSETSTGFFFASEISALLQLADCGRETDHAALDAFLALRYVPGARTAWRNVRRLPAASTLHVRDGAAAEPQRYWRLRWAHSSQTGFSEEDAVEGFRRRFEESVKLRMIADVPLGAFLSGGVDSSVTAAAMTRLGGKVKTFCIGFEDARFDESPHSREVARRLGTDHHEIIVAPDSLDSLDSLIEKSGEPFADHSLLPTHALSRFARQTVTVALSGDGGDEFFAGYKRYRHLAQAQFLQRWGMARPWRAASRALFRLEQRLNPSRRRLEWPRSYMDRILGLEPLQQYLCLIGCWSSEERRLFWKTKVEEDAAASLIAGALASAAGLDGWTQSQAVDVETYLGDDILRKVDIASMACSLECRCPFLDHEAAGFAAMLPSDSKADWRGRTKLLLKKLYPDFLPPALFARRKKGFSMPIGSWMRKQWKEVVQNSIEDSWPNGMDACFDRRILTRIWKEHQEGRQDHGERLWSWLVLFRWNQRFCPQWKA